jgi:predicted DNA-binding ribbon-helix-helix protein
VNLIRSKAAATSVRFTTSQYKKLQAEARRLRVTRSDLIRDIVDEHFTRQTKEKA